MNARAHEPGTVLLCVIGIAGVAAVVVLAYGYLRPPRLAAIVEDCEPQELLAWSTPDQLFPKVQEFLQDDFRFNAPGNDHHWNREAWCAIHLCRELQAVGWWEIARPATDPPDVYLRLDGTAIHHLEVTDAVDPQITRDGHVAKSARLLEQERRGLPTHPQDWERLLVPGSPWCANHPNAPQSLEVEGVRWILSALGKKCLIYASRALDRPLNVLVYARFDDAEQLMPGGNLAHCWSGLQNEAAILLDSCPAVASAWLLATTSRKAHLDLLGGLPSWG